jgi:hypothetical protein
MDMQSDELPPPQSSSEPPPQRSRSSFKFVFVMIVLIAIAFLVGYVPCMLRARETRATLQSTQIDLQLANLHRRLGVASHEAQRNNYANASAAAREFFDGCGAIARSEAFDNQPRTRIALTAFADSRDEIMAKLAMGDPQSKERLSSMYLTMDGVLARRQ